MSGPKVVRIVTREEHEAICRGMLARIDAALEQWAEAGRRNDFLDAPAVEAARRRRDALAALAAQGRFAEMQVQAPAEESFLRSDMRFRLEKAAAAKAAARTHARRRSEAGVALIRAAAAAGVVLPDGVMSGLEQGEEAALAEGFRALAANRPTSHPKSTLAEQLRPGERTLSFSDWLAAQPAAPTDPDIDRIEARLEELVALGEVVAIEPLRKRLTEASGAPSSRRGLLLDGLEVESGRVLAEARKAADLMSALRVLLAEMAQAGLPVAAFAVSEDAAPAIKDIQARLGAAEAALARHRGDEAASARRAAVMKGLAGLGYEVREGMTTTFAASGRLVVADASRPGYGVEVSGAADGRQFQMRPVAFTAPGERADTSRDRDAETTWCGQVSELSKTLAASGGGMEIVRALPIGATPLKRVANADYGSVEGTEAMVTKERSMPKP
ncbi:hypothetical protein [Bosea sp. (in: a-proteobacteria)]|uniref:hypothetical protein n=1 Tax=Bosea sp. (in: a-proteobacteria) TaxID=1871050 RepID=UPI001AC8C7C0|nr:hypothetical protein [Bosea sp. (in: a-proteobacteria)]MBN9438476.1 hypothetical protein [Bosea sp. (in: a-proteobacteria)]